MGTEIFFDAGLDRPNQIESVGENRAIAHGVLGPFKVADSGSKDEFSKFCPWTKRGLANIGMARPAAALHRT